MKYFNNDKEFKQVFSAIDNNFKLMSVESFGQGVESVIIAEIGQLTADKILGDSAVLQVMRRVVANLTMANYANSGALLISDAGVQVATGSNRAPASDKKLMAFRRDCTEYGWKAFEELITILEVRSAEYGEWRLSNERKQYFDTLFSNSGEFGPFGGVPVSATLFRNIKTQIQFVQDDYLEPVLGRALLDQLIAMNPIISSANPSMK